MHSSIDRHFSNVSAMLLLSGVLAACASETATERDVRNYVRACWSASAEMMESVDQPVGIIMQMNPDKTLKSAEIDPADREKMSDPAYRAFADGALQAVQTCGADGQKFPIEDDLPFSEWNQITLRFASGLGE